MCLPVKVFSCRYSYFENKQPWSFKLNWTCRISRDVIKSLEKSLDLDIFKLSLFPECSFVLSPSKHVPVEVNNRNTTKMCEIWSKLTIKTLCQLFSQNIRKVFFWENIRHFFGASLPWSIRNFLEVDFFYSLGFEKLPPEIW